MPLRFLRKLFGFETCLDNLERLQRRVTPRLELLEERTLLSGNMQVSIVAPPAAAPGASVTYLVTVANVDSEAASGVSLTESLPSGVTYQSQVQTGGPSFTLSQDANVVTDTIDSLDAGASASFSITGVVAPDEAPGAVLTDTAAATGSGALSGSVPWFTTVQQSGSGGGSDSMSRGSGSAGGASVSYLSSGSGAGLNAASGSTATTLSSNFNPSVAGQTVTFTAVVNGLFNTMASEGYVSFWNGPNEVATGSLAATDTTHQFATFATPLPAGSWPYTATFPGNGSFLPSTGAHTQNVVPATTTSLVSSVDPSAPGYPVTFTATVAAQSGSAAPTGNVTFYSNGTSLGTVPVATGSSSSTASLSATFATAGSYGITAAFNGGSGFGPSSSALTQTVESETTSTYLTSGANPSYYGNYVTFTATVVGAFHDAPQGNVTFECNGVTEATVPLSGGGSNYTLASFSMPFPTQGNFPMTAVYDPAPPFLTSTGTLTQTVQAETTSTYLQSSANPSYYGNYVTFTATVVGAVGAPTGNVTFECNGVTEATVPLSGGGSNYKLASFSMLFPTQGGFPITATYDPDNTFDVSSTSLTQTVQAETTSTYLQFANPSVVGQDVTFTATVVGAVGAPTGNVTFEVNSYQYPGATAPLAPAPQLGPNYSVATFTLQFLSPGSNTIAAIYDPDNTFDLSSDTLPQTVNQAPTSTYVSSDDGSSLAGQTVALTALVVRQFGGTPTGSVTFKDNGNSLGTVPVTQNPTGSQAVLYTSGLSAGSHSITAVYSGDPNYAGSTTVDPWIQTVSLNPASVTLTSGPNPAAYGQAITFTATVAGAFGLVPTGQVTFEADAASIGQATLAQDGTGAQAVLLCTSDLAVGAHTITATYAGDANFSGGTSGALNQTVNPVLNLAPIPDQTNTEGDAVTLTPSVSGQAPGSTLAYSASGLPAGLEIDASSGAVTGTVAEGDAGGGPYSVTVTASEGTQSASATFDWTVVHFSIFNPGDQTNVVGDSVTVPGGGSDPDGDAITFTAANLPLGLSIDPSSGYITGTVGAGASTNSPYSVTETASDGTNTASLTFSWTILPFNLTNPGDQTNAVGDAVNVQTGASDPDGDALTFSASNLPPGLSINPNSGDITGMIAYTAADGVPYAVTLTASDGANTVSQMLDWTVTHVFVVNPGDQTNADGDNVSLALSGGDNYDAPVTYSAAGLPPGLGINDTGNITGTISDTDDANSPYTVTVFAADGTYSDSQTFQWTVNRFLIANPGDQTNYDGDVVSLPISATDNLGDTLTFSATGLPTGLSIDAGAGLISGTIDPAADGDSPYSVTVTASGGGASDSQTFNWTVSNPISIASVDDQVNVVGDSVTLPITAATATGGTLIYAASGLPDGLSINASTGVVTGTIAPTASVTTPYDVAVTVNDGAISASQSFSWFVSELALTNPGPQTNATGDVVSLGISVQDNSGDTLAFQAANLPQGLSIDGQTGVISGTISANADAGSPYTVTASVTAGGYTASQTFSWAVSRIVIVAPGTQSGTDGDAVSLQISARDNNADTLTFGATDLPAGLSINSTTGVISGAISSTADANSPYMVTVTANDGAGHSATMTFLWSVAQLTLTNPGDQFNATGDQADVQLLGLAADGTPLTYAAAGLPEGLSINPSTGVISGAVGATADGDSPYAVTVTASDGLGATASQVFQWAVDDVYVANPGDQTYQASQTVTLPIVAHDNDGDALTYGVTGLPAGLALSGTEIVGVVASSAVSATPYDVIETVRNSLGQVATAALTMTVGDAPPPKTFFNVSAWNDMNRDWDRQTLEPGVKNVLVTLYNSTGQSVAKPFTNSDGVVATTLAAGDYSVDVSAPAGYSVEILTISGVPAPGDKMVLHIDPSKKQSETFHVAAGSSVTLSVALTPAGTPMDQIIGPAVVPGNSQYVYAVDFSGLESNVDWTTTVITPVGAPAGVVQIVSQDGSTPNNRTSEAVELVFGNSIPAQVKLTLDYGQGHSTSLLITVVQVQIKDPPLIKPFGTPNESLVLRPPAGADFGKATVAAIGVDSQGISAAGKPVIAFDALAQVVLTGPNKNQGVDKIHVGFIQHATESVDQAVYQKAGEVLTPKHAGKPLTEYGALLDNDKPKDAAPWYKEQQIFDDATADNSTGYVAMEDSPRDAWPLSYDQALVSVLSQNKWPTLDLIKRINHKQAYEADIAAETTDPANGASSLYYVDARAPWSVDDSGVFMLNLDAASPKNSTFTYTQDQKSPVAVPKSWLDLQVTSPTLEDTSGPIANDVSHDVEFS